MKKHKINRWKVFCIILSLITFMRYNAQWDRIVDDVYYIGKLKKRIMAEIKYQYVRKNYPDWIAVWFDPEP